MSAYAPVSALGDGSTTSFPFFFDYLRQSNIIVKLNGVLLENGVDYTINDGTKRIITTTPPDLGETLSITRLTPTDLQTREIAFSSGSGFDEDDMDGAVQQSLLIDQEQAYELETFDTRLAAVEPDVVFDNVAALSANTTTVKNGAIVHVKGYYDKEDGAFGPFLISDDSSSDSADGVTCFVDQNGMRYKRTFLGVIHAKNGGAKGDGTTDDYAVLQGILDTGNNLLLDASNYLVSGTLVLNYEGQSITGVAGNANAAGTAVATVILSEATSGPVIRHKARTTSVKRLFIDSTAARRAAVTTSGHGVLFEDDDGATSSISRGLLYDLNIANQPTDGVHVAGGAELALLEQVSVQDCIRHGYVFDDGTRQSRTDTTLSGFMVKLSRCRAFECGGNGLIATNSTQNFVLDHFESLGCCWDSAQRENLYQVYTTVQNLILRNPDVEDQQYANSTTSGGETRTALATPSKGIYVGSPGFNIINGYFSSLLESVVVASTSGNGEVVSPLIRTGNYGVAQSVGITIQNGADGVEVKGTTQAGATTLVSTQAKGTSIQVDGVEYYGTIYTPYDVAVPFEAETAYTISGGTLTAPTTKALVKGESDTTDSVAYIRHWSGGDDGLVGAELTAIYDGSGYDITWVHGTNNIITNTGADVTMNSTTNTVMKFIYDGTDWVQI